MPVHDIDTLLAEQTARWESMTDDEREYEAFEWWDRHPDECERLRYTSANLILDLVLDRTRRRHSALAELDAINAAHRRVVFNMQSSDAELDAAEAEHESALAAWHLRYDSLWPEDEMKPYLQLVPSPEQPANALPLTFFDDCGRRSPKRWIFKNAIAAGENSSWFGAPGTLKSALLQDMMVSAARGLDWRGFKNKQCVGSVFFAFERADQARRRLAAYAKRDGIEGLPIAVADRIINMLDPACVDIIVDTVAAAEARLGVPVGIVAFDTWSKGIAAGGGDEDKAQHQNIVAANLRRVHERTDGRLHIAGIGHSGKDESRGERGSNARQGDVDMQVQITGGDTIKTATVIKANDQAEGPLTAFAGEIVEMGVDDDGDKISAFILSTKIYNSTPKESNISDQQRLALDALRTATDEHGERIEGVKWVSVERWREQLQRSGVTAHAKNERSAFKKIRDGLAAKKRIVESDGRVRFGYAAPIMPLTGLPLPPPPGN